jgi:MFS superfamily sulfate permease-like transporter
MKIWLEFVSEQAITGIDAIALVVILIGTIEVVVGVIRLAFGTHSHQFMRDV